MIYKYSSYITDLSVAIWKRREYNGSETIGMGYNIRTSDKTYEEETEI